MLVVLLGFAFAKSVHAAEEAPDEPSEPSVEAPLTKAPLAEDEVEVDESRTFRRYASPPAPIGVRRAQAIASGELRLGYSYERLRNRELQVSGADRTQTEILNPTSLLAPVALDVTEHIFSLAYAPHSRVTLVAEIPLIVKELEQLSSAGRNQRQTQGLGDVSLAVIVPFIQKGRESSQLHIAVEAPTGSIQKDGPTGRLPYDNQIGNGTWDLEWGWTYRGERDHFSWGAQLMGHHPVGTNSLHYREGSRFDVSMWSGVRVFRGLSASLRLAGQKQNNTRGADRNLSLVTDGPAANTKARGGFRVDLNPGITLELPELGRQRLAVEFGVPVYEEVDGPRLAREYSFKVGWQWVY